MKTKQGVNHRQFSALQEEVDALELEQGADMGANATPVARTNNPIVGANSVNSNIDLLDAAIGPDADLTPVTRVTGQLVAGTSILKKIDELDAVIGFDSQMAGTPLNIAKAQTIYQNLDALDAKKTVRTIKKTIGNIGVTADFNFVTAANVTEQSINLGAILPAKCRVLDVMLFTDAAFTNLGALTTDVGLTAGAAEFISAGNNTAINAIMASANGGTFIGLPTASARNIYVNVVPTNNWSSATPVGKMTVYVTIIDLTNL